MEISQCIIDFCQKYINRDTSWYSWNINENLLPSNITLQEGNSFSKNLELKYKLHDAWKNSTDKETKGNLIKYYISTWGGIRTNSEKTMINYISLPADSLVQYGIKGISSWSKALVIHDPKQYAIFDARVSVAINSLQIINNLPQKKLFPILQSRNTTITNGNLSIKEIARKSQWQEIHPVNVYAEYLSLLKTTSEKFEKEISIIEMLLFAKAEELVNAILELKDK